MKLCIIMRIYFILEKTINFKIYFLKILNVFKILYALTCLVFWYGHIEIILLKMSPNSLKIFWECICSCWETCEVYDFLARCTNLLFPLPLLYAPFSFKYCLFNNLDRSVWYGSAVKGVATMPSYIYRKVWISTKKMENF